MGMDPNQGPGGPQYPPPPPPGAGYAAPMGGYAPAGPSFAPTQAPVPAGVGNLFQKWINVTTKPGVQSFVNELPTANWRDVWISLAGLAVLSIITTAIRTLEAGAAATAFLSALPAAQRAMLSGLTTPSIGTAFASIITVPIGFFIGVGILWLVAKMFGGRGSFLTQSYAFALFYLPIAAVSAVLGIIPVLGGLVGFALGIYSIILAIFAVAASHLMSTGRATAVVLIPIAVLFVLACGLSILFAALLLSIYGGAVPGVPTFGPFPTP